jgi:hypothetical protein
MGMFDEIIVPKSYLKGLLTKDQEKLLKVSSRYGGSVRGIEFQTKCLENALFHYKIYKQTLFKNDGSLWNCEPPDTEQRNKSTSKKYPYEKGRWNKVAHDGTVNFYMSLYDKDKSVWWIEFQFTFVGGVIDKKELVKFEILETAEETKEKEEIWKKRSAEIDAFQKTLKYKFFEKLRAALSRILEWVQKKTILPSPNSVKIDRQQIAKKRKKLSFWKDY